MPSNKYTVKKSQSSKNIIDKLNSINPEINVFTLRSMNIFPEIINRLAKIGKIDKDTLNNLIVITYEHYKIIIEDFKNKIIRNQNVNKNDVKKLINEILLHQIHLQSSPKFQETIQKGGHKIMIKIADIIVYIVSIFALISTIFWVFVFTIKASIMVFKPIEYLNDEPYKVLREKSFIFISLEILMDRLIILFLSNIRNRLSNMLNENNDDDDDVVDNEDIDNDHEEIDNDEIDDVRDLIINITGYMGDIIMETNIIPLSVGKISRKKSNSRFKSLRRATIPYHEDKILNKEILEVDLKTPNVFAIQNYQDPQALSSVKTPQEVIPLSDQVYQVAYTDEQLANQVYDEFGQAYDEIGLHLRNLNKPVTARRIWGGTKKRVKKNRRNTKKSSTK